MLLTGHTATWNLCAPIALPRAGYAAGVLDGRWIVAGGSYWTPEGKRRTTAVDALDAHCNCWSTLPSMPIAMSDAASVTIGNKLYVLGGADDAGSSRAVYDFDGKHWVHRQDMQLPEARMSGAAVTDGHRIYLLGGISTEGDYSSGLRSAWSMDPEHAKDGWRRLPDCPCDPRISFAATMLHGRILLFGGYRAAGSEHQNLADVWSYNLSTQAWTKAGMLPEGRRAMWASSVNDTVYLFGGYTDTFSADILAWRNGVAHPIAQLPQAVADAKFFPIGCYWYTVGGETAIHVRGAHTWAGSIPVLCKEKM
ncbi:MAG: Kelch repeat-containing protein [Acidobacteriaceae bacterium]